MLLDGKNSRIQIKPYTGRYVLLACVIPMLLTLLSFVALRITPFGDRSLVIGDANAYYIPYLSYCKSVFQGKHGLFYSFSQDIGSGIAATIWPYFLNPFSWIISCFQYEAYPTGYSVGIIFATALYGFSMYLLLADIHGHKLESALISTCYAMSGFAVCFNINTAFFFGGPFCLPLMVLGLRKLFRHESPLLYTLSIAYPVILQIQMGFAVCMAAVLLFLAKFFFEDRAKRSKSLIFRFIGASVIGGLLGAVVWLPEMMVIRQGRGTFSLEDFSFSANTPLLQIGTRLFTGANNTAQIADGYPAIFCGILPLALAVLYFMNKNIEKRRKAAFIVLLTVYILGFYIRTFTSIFQGFTHANWFNYRFSFVFIFLLLLIAAEQLDRMEEISSRDAKLSGIIILGFAVLVFFPQYEFVDGAMIVIDLALLAIMGAAFILHRKAPDRAPKRILVLLFCLCTFFQLYLNYYICNTSIFQEWKDAGTEYADSIGQKEPLIRAIQKSDDGFYRIESEKMLDGSIGNDGLFLDYNGVGFGGHTERRFVSVGLSRLGINLYSGCWNTYDTGIPAATDALLGIKYVLSERDLTEEKDYARMVDLNGLALYESSYSLPIAMVSNNDIMQVDIAKSTNVFENINAFWISLTGDSREVFNEETDIRYSNHNPSDVHNVTYEEVMSISEDGAELLPATTANSDTKNSSDKNLLRDEVKAVDDRYSPFIEFVFTAKQTGPIYLYDYSSYVEGNGTMEDILQYIGYYREGEEVTGRLFLSYTVTEQLMIGIIKQLHICYEDIDLLNEYCGQIISRNCSIEKESDSRLSGTVNIRNNQRLFFTIPYDNGWTLKVDGVETPLDMTADLFMSANLEPGTHHYELAFRPEGFVVGTIISVVAMIALAVMCVIELKKRFRKEQSMIV